MDPVTLLRETTLTPIAHNIPTKSIRAVGSLKSSVHLTAALHTTEQHAGLPPWNNIYFLGV